MNSVMFLIISTQKHLASRQKAQKETFLSGQEYRFLSDITTADNVCLSERSDYFSAVEKQLNGIRYASTLEGYEWFVFCDDDTFVNVPNLHFALDPKLASIGHVLDRDSNRENPIWSQMPYLTKYFSGGAGFVLHHSVVKRLSSLNLSPHPGVMHGDVSVGLLMRQLGLPLHHNDLFFTQPPLSYGHNASAIAKAISYHYIPPVEMNALYSSYARS